MVVKPQTEFNAPFLSEHDLRRRHTPEIHTRKFVKLGQNSQQLVHNLPDHALRQSSDKLQQFQQRPSFQVLGQYGNCSFRVVELLTIDCNKVAVLLVTRRIVLLELILPNRNPIPYGHS